MRCLLPSGRLLPVAVGVEAMRQGVGGVFLGGVELNFAAAFAQLHARLVDHDTGEPGEQGTAALELGQGPMGGDPAVLDRLFRVRRLQQGARGAQQARMVVLDHQGEGGPVTRPQAFDELGGFQIRIRHGLSAALG